MALTNNLISQFVKATNDNKDNKPKETTTYGTIVRSGDVNYVRLDGSDLLTPYTTTTVVKDGDRVLVTIKNHEVVVTGSTSSPSASNESVIEIGDRITELDTLIADKVTTGELEAQIASVNKLITDNIDAVNADIDKLETETAKIETLEADVVEVNKTLSAHTGRFDTVEASIADLENLTTGNFEATNADIHNLEADYASFKSTTTDTLEAQDASIENLETNKLDTETAKITYANIDFSNIDIVTMGKFFADSGVIDNVVIKDGHVTGQLVGVTIIGDLIEGGTVKADKLVIKGTDGLYYKLNTDGESVTSEQTEYNSLNGSIITAKSITAEKIKVTDLVAFGATIGGFHIGDHALYSGVKNSVSNTTEGIFLGDDGQINIGDGVNFVKFIKDQNGDFKLEISADTISFGSEKKTVESLYEAVTTNSEDLTAYMESTNKELSNLQGQIDGSIMTWFFEYVPTNSNLPASEWTTTDLKNNHLGDLFYDTITGYCYRWQVENNQYSWNRITDVDVTKALADAKNAQDTADSKRRVFVNTPTTPYDVGDLWTQGSNGDLMRCKTAKTKSQSYAAADWEKASKYTDDTAVNALSTRVTTAETNITKNAEAIELRATKTEVTEQINNIEIGGTNLVPNSIYVSDMDLTTTKVWTRNRQRADVQYGETYTLSLYYNDVYMPGEEHGYAYTYAYASDGTRVVTGDYMMSKISSGRSTVTIDDPNIAYMLVEIGIWNCSVGDVYKVKLEKGNKSTDWSPAPEDIENKLTNNYYNKTQTDAKIKVESDKIALQAAEISETKETLTQVVDATDVIATTEEATSFHLTDSADSSCRTVEIFGKSYQETRNGYNKLNITDLDTTINDVVIKAQNGVISATGNGTAFASPNIITGMPQETLPPGTYTLCLGNVQADCYYRLYDADGNSLSRPYLWYGRQPVTITVENWVKFESINLYVGADVQIDNLAPMLLEGAYTADNVPPFEQYGAKPSPAYPSEIKSIVNKNLLNISDDLSTKFPYTVKDLTMNLNEDGTFQVTGNNQTSGWTTFSFATELTVLKAGVTYYSPMTLSCFKVSDGSWYGNIGNKFTPTEDIRFTGCYWATNQQGEINATIMPMLVVGGIKPTKYIPYDHIKITAIGKNMFNINNVEWGKYNVYNNSAGNYTDAFIGYVDISPNTSYSISASASRNFRFSYQFLDDDANVLGGVYSSIPQPSKAFENVISPSNATKLLISQLDFKQTDEFEVQVEQGDIITEYEPCTENAIIIPLLHDLRSLPNGSRDRIFRDNETGKWYDEQVLEEVVIDGTIYPNSIAVNSNTGNTTFIFTNSVAPNKKNAYIAPLCNQAVGVAVTGWRGYKNQIIQWVDNTASFCVGLSTDKVGETANSIMEWFNNNPLKIIYELAEPIITEITDPEMLNALESIRTFKVITNIYADAPTILTYYRDTAFVEAYETKANADANYRKTQGSIEELTTTTMTTSSQISELNVKTDAINASVADVRTKQTITESAIGSMNTEIETLTKSVEAKMTSEQVTIAIKTELQNGVSKVTTNTGYTFNDDGLIITKSGKEMRNVINEEGMTIHRGDEERLVANNDEVRAYNLHAKTWLIVGESSRLEDYTKDGKVRTGCFWIGETEVE